MLEYFFVYWTVTFIFTGVLLSLVDELNAKLLFLIFSIYLFLFFVYIFSKLDFSSIFFYSYTFEISIYYNIFFTVGIDQISILFLLLTSFIFIIVGLIAWNSIRFKINLFFFTLLILEFFILNVFISFDLLFFYIWSESTLVPMFFIIIVWGNQPRKIGAAFYLVLYTLVLSLFFFWVILHIHSKFGTTNIFVLSYFIFLNKSYQLLFWFAFFLAFAVKLPIFPFHIWLPEAHVEAPTTGSIILAGLLSKLGYYGCIRFFMQLFPFALAFYKPLIAILCIAGGIYGSLLALSQIDMKKIIAYSSVSHMSFCLLGVVSSNIFGLVGSMLMAIGHGFVSVALFSLIGVIYDRYHTRVIDYFSGIGSILPIFSFFLFNFIISNFCFPVSLNFVSELFILIGIGTWSLIVVLVLIFYSVLGVSYNLYLYIRLCHGTIRYGLIVSGLFNDLSKIESFVLFPLFSCNIILCFLPNTLIGILIPAFLLFL